MRLIDADALYQRVYDAFNDWPSESNLLMSWINEAQTIEPVKHGQWQMTIFHNGCTPDYDCVCSICGESGTPDKKYCPNCGAKMQDNSCLCPNI